MVTIVNQRQGLSRGRLELPGLSHIWGSRTLIMGIINATPDSFSGDGLLDCEAALALARRHLVEGADILDIGGESTRPGHKKVSESEELVRVLPILQKISQELSAPISLDTTKAAVASAGGHILNSVQGISDELLAVAVQRDLPVVIMHNKAKAEYQGDVMDEVLSFLSDHAAKAARAGLKREQIILDPGIGFGKLPAHSIRVLSQLERLVALGYPTLIGTSRKSFIGHITGQPVEKRVFGTAASLALAIAAGIDIVRVHDVAAARDVVQVSDAIVRVS
jgi:dihydropteroate synthase